MVRPDWFVASSGIVGQNSLESADTLTDAGGTTQHSPLPHERRPVLCRMRSRDLVRVMVSAVYMHRSGVAIPVPDGNAPAPATLTTKRTPNTFT